MNKFEIINKTSKQIDEIEVLKSVVEYALKSQGVDNSIFNIIIVDCDEIKNINKIYRGKDSVTDVISFALEDDTTFIKTDFRVLGDIYISIPKMKSQAEEYGHSEKRELSFLVVHGILHLSGYDHLNPRDEEIMFNLQKEILNDLNIKE